jgi:hypothetical protein
MHRHLAVFAALSLLPALSACSSDPEEPPTQTAGTGGSGGGSGGGTSGTGGSGGGASGSGGGASDPTVPSMLTQAGWESWLTAMSYTQNGWVGDAAVREASSTVSPHGRVRVWFNPTMIASIAAGNGAMIGAPPHTVNSMVVKELYDAETLVGHAVSLKVDAGPGGGGWQYYCKGPAERCYSGSDAATALFAKGDLNCGSCHGGLVFATPP